MQTDKYRKVLSEERSYILATQTQKTEVISQQGRVAEEDQAPISHEQFISLKVNGISQSKLRLVNEALERLRDGGYGICDNCDEPIPSRRLQAVPWAKYCVTCEDRATASDIEASPALFETDAA